jgi:uncharacterized protein YeaO (DUF488 family)
MVKVKRVYEEKSSADGRRILVDRLWPRGMKKEEAAIDQWLKEVSPSTELRRWFSHDPAKWDEFKKRYGRELEGKEALIESLKKQAKRGTVTLLYSAKNETLNNAVALKEMIDGRKSSPSAGR